MPRCIYSWVDLNDNNPADDSTQSKEHIVPWAIGGSNGLTTFDVSRKYNNYFGSTIDRAFSDVLPIAVKRHELKIEGQKGSIPPIVWGLRSRETNNIGRVTIEAEGDVSVTFDPVVITESHPGIQKRLVAGSPDPGKENFRRDASKCET